jgi:hypothetical protein
MSLGRLEALFNTINSVMLLIGQIIKEAVSKRQRRFRGNMRNAKEGTGYDRCSPLASLSEQV